MSKFKKNMPLCRTFWPYVVLPFVAFLTLCYLTQCRLTLYRLTLCRLTLCHLTLCRWICWWNGCPLNASNVYCLVLNLIRGMVESSPNLLINLLRNSIEIYLYPTFFLLRNQQNSDRVKETGEVLLQICIPWIQRLDLVKSEHSSGTSFDGSNLHNKKEY